MTVCRTYDINFIEHSHLKNSNADRNRILFLGNVSFNQKHLKYKEKFSRTLLMKNMFFGDELILIDMYDIQNK